MENGNKKVIFTIVCCHSNSLLYTHMKEKEIPGVLQIFTVNARSLNPKLKQIVHFSSSSGVRTVLTVRWLPTVLKKTVGSHLKGPKHIYVR